MLANSRFNKLKKALSNKKTGIIILLLSIAARIILQLYFFDISGDRSFQLVAVKSFVEDHGFSILQILPDNLDKEMYSPIVGWPPGYSIFLLPFYFVCGKNVIAAAIFFEIISAVMFIIITKRLLELLDVPLWLVNIYMLVSGFFIYDFARASSSDFYALILFLFAIYCALLFIKTKRAPTFGIVVGILLFLCLLIRYMYTPMVLAVALYLLYAGYLQHDKRILRGGFYCVSLLTLLLVSFYLYQYRITGSATYIIATEKGFFISNILRTNAFLFTPFIDIPLLCSSLSSLFYSSYAREVKLIWLIHLLPYSALLLYCIDFLIKKIKTKKDLAEHYVYLGLITSLSIIFLLTFLSLRNAPVPYPLWTFVQEPRYYAFIVVFIHQLLFIYLFNIVTKIKGTRKIFVIATVILLFFQIVHGIYFVTKKIVSEGNNLTAHKKFKETEQFFYSSLDSLEKAFPDKKVITTSNDPTFQNLAVLKGYKSLYQSSAINNPSNLNPSRNKVFLVILQSEALPEYKNFLQLPATKQIGTVDGYYFYVLET